MDVHRVRFIQHPTPTITCFAFSRSHDAKPPLARDDLRLALGRADGSIEIWNPSNGAWIQETIFPPSGEDSVDSLLWTQDPNQTGPDDEIIAGQLRLFSIGSSSNVTEWDLTTGTVKRKNTGNFGEVWCFAAQPRATASSKDQAQAQELVVGCGDGTIALLSTSDDDLQFKRYLARVTGKKARCLTIEYQKPNVVVAGFADGTMRVFDTRNGSILRTVSLGAGMPGAPKTTLVWKVVCLANGDIVSADSNGELRVWDGKLYTMTQRLRGHKGDCLDLVASKDGRTLFSGGVDGYIANYHATTVDRGRLSWAKISHRRIREGHGPVKALAAYDGANLSTVLTAGNDSAPTVVPLRAFGKEHIRALPFLPHTCQVASAPAARFLVTWYGNVINIHKLRSSQLDADQDPASQAHQLIARIQLSTHEHVRAVSISHSGRLLAASTSTQIKLFQLKPKSLLDHALAIRKINLPNTFAKLGASSLQISPDDAWLSIVTPQNEVHIARLDRNADRPKLFRVVEHTAELEPSWDSFGEENGLGAYQRNINQLVFNSDGDILVASNLAGCVSSWTLQGKYDATASASNLAAPNPKQANGHDHGDDNDSASDSSSDDGDDDEIAFYGQGWRANPAPTLPRLDSAASVLTFRSSTKHHLFVITARHQLYEFDLALGRLTDWSRDNPTSSLPEDFTKIKERAMGAIWDPRHRLWLYGPNFLFMLDVNQSLHDPALHTFNKKRQVNGDDDNDDLEAVYRKKQKISGAGDRISSRFRNVAGPEKLRKLAGGSTIDEMSLHVGKQDIQSDDDDHVDLGLTLRDETIDVDEQQAQLGRRTWHTFKYRPILGMVPLSTSNDPLRRGNDVFEVAIVEQPPLQQSTSTNKR